MMNFEEAEKQLEQFKAKSWEKTVKRRLNGLSPSTCKVARRLVFDEWNNRSLTNWAAEILKKCEAVEHLDRLTPTKRLKVFESVFPQITKHIEACWQRMKTGTYTNGYYRKPFRQPDQQDATQFYRALWFQVISCTLKSYDQDILWLATWAGYFSHHGSANAIGLLLASAMDQGGEEGDRVLQILIDSANGDHEVGIMGRHIPVALLFSNRPEAWEFIEKLLLAAQRQEGLRQDILEAVDMANPEAFKRMLRLILDENLVRFASVVRAADVWFGMRWDSSAISIVKNIIQWASCYLEDDSERQKALDSNDPQKVFVAMWATAYNDAKQAMNAAIELLNHKTVDLRFTGAWFLTMLGMEQANHALTVALDDDDLRVAGIALASLPDTDHAKTEKSIIFDQLENLYHRLPKKAYEGKPLLWPWMVCKISRAEVADQMGQYVGDNQWDRIIQHVPKMSPGGRMGFIRQLEKRKTWPDATRDLLLKLTGDASPAVRGDAINLLKKKGIKPGDIPHLESLLKRKSGDLRRGIMALLYKQKPAAILATCERLVQTKDQMQQQGGVELLVELSKNKRHHKRCEQISREYKANHPEPTETIKGLLKQLLGDQKQAVSLDDALGLMDRNKLSFAPAPVDRKVVFESEASKKCIDSLVEYVEAHKETPLPKPTYDEEAGMLGVWNPHRMRHYDSMENDKHQFALADLWLQWNQQRSDELRDEDGLELIRAAVATHQKAHYSHVGFHVSNNTKRLSVVSEILNWLAEATLSCISIDFILDAAETMLSKVPRRKALKLLRDPYQKYLTWLMRAKKEFTTNPIIWTDDQIKRFLSLQIWVDRPMDINGKPLIIQSSKSEANSGASMHLHTLKLTWQGKNDDIPTRFPLSTDAVVNAYRLGLYNDHDILDILICTNTSSYFGLQANLLRHLSRYKAKTELKSLPQLNELIQKFISRVIEIELDRGDEPTIASHLATSIRCIRGVEILIRLVNAMKGMVYQRGFESGYYHHNGYNRKAVFSHLIRVSHPSETDTPESFAAAVHESKITEKQLLELVIFAPQWSVYIEHALNWPGLEDAVWWLHGHTKDYQWYVEQEIRQSWEARITERTPLTSEELLNGAVDVDWFQRAYRKLGAKRWASLDKYAKNASSSGGHKRAQLFANAMLGKVTKTELVKRIKDKRHKDVVRAIGLLPLAKGNRREKDLLSRYELLQEFLRSSKKFGSQRQNSEKQAVEIGQVNLARSAGYADPLRLQWAMEQKAVADLTEGPVSITAKEIVATLSINETGDPQFEIKKAGKLLKTVPAAAKKNKQISELRKRKTALKRQSSRMRQSLESMMCRGETITGDELAGLMNHPMLKPMLERIVWIGEGITGYPSEGGKLLVNHHGKLEPVKKDELLRMAHPYDLLQSGGWSNWQSDCFAAERIQPFKQVFRELYVLTDAERESSPNSKRYAGHQVNPSQAIALLGRRGWIIHPEEGVRKTFHDQKLSVWLEFQEAFYTPAEIDGLTLENVMFTKAGQYKPIDLADIPPMIFSEVMRDLDLVVSVAHRGGVDPEASASTVEMRSALLAETLSVLDVGNVRIKDRYALIDGELGNYTVHLGSAVTHIMPGGSLFIVPVHSQHRGRLFLPFADDDPKTAEVMSKVLLLAEDKQIKDSSILTQIRQMSR